MSLSKSKIISDYVKKLDKLYLKDLFYEVLNKEPETIDYQHFVNSSINSNYEAIHDLTSMEYQDDDDNITDFTISSIKNIQNIAMLGNNSSVSLNESGLNIIFGDNGVGKSSYCQILKFFLKSRDNQTPKKNAFKDITSQSAFITLKTLQSVRQYNIFDENPDFIKNGLIFDNSLQNLYLNKDFTDIDFRLPGIDVISQFRTSLETLEQEIHNKKTNIQITPIPQKILDVDSINQFNNSKNLTELNSNLEKLQSKFTWTAEDNREAGTLKEFFLANKNKEQTIKKLTTEKEYLEKILLSIKWIIKNNKVIILNNKKIKEEEKKLLALKTISGISDNDTSSSNWHNMVLHSFEYLKENNISLTKEDSCPLCNNKLDEKGLLYISNFFTYINNTSNKAIKELQDANKKLIKNEHINLLKYSFPTSIPFKKNEDDNFDYKNEETISYFITNNLSSIVSDFENLSLESTEELDNIEEKAQEHLGFINTRIDEIKNASPEDKEIKLKKFEDKKEHKHIFDNQSLIKQFYTDKSTFFKYNSVSLTTEKRVCSSYISDIEGTELINQFTRHFKEAFDFFEGKIIDFKAQLSNRAGNSYIKLKTTTPLAQNISITEILSQGEQRIIALCAFYAEAMLQNSKTPVIFDDPVSSLDYNYKSLIAEFIINISKAQPERQIIIFTHDIGFKKDLNEQIQDDTIISKNINLCKRNGQSGISAIDDKATIKKRITKLYESKESFEELDINGLKVIGNDIYDITEEILPYVLKVGVRKVKQLDDVLFDTSYKGTLSKIQKNSSPLRHGSTGDFETEDSARRKITNAIDDLNTFYKSIIN